MVRCKIRYFLYYSEQKEQSTYFESVKEHCMNHYCAKKYRMSLLKIPKTTTSEHCYHCYSCYYSDLNYSRRLNVGVRTDRS
jgi:superfamily II DNA helicase RecQ